MVIKKLNRNKKTLLVITVIILVAVIAGGLVVMNRMSTPDDNVAVDQETGDSVSTVDELTMQGDFVALIVTLKEQLADARTLEEKNDIVGQLTVAYQNNGQNEDAVAVLDEHFAQYETELDAGFIRIYAEALDGVGRYADALEYYNKFKEKLDPNDAMYNEFIKDTDKRILEIQELL